MRNGRCRMHGGPSTGPRTPEGLERSRNARKTHGYYSRRWRAELRKAGKSVRRVWQEGGHTYAAIGRIGAPQVRL